MNRLIILKVSNMLHVKNVPNKIRFHKASALLQKLFSTNQPLPFYKETSKAFQKFKLKQARMQCDDELPVYLKAGIRDKILFNITLTMLLCNTIGSIWTIREFLRKS